MKKSAAYINITVLILVVATITSIIFNTHFAKITIDVWAFAASLFLIIEASMKIRITKDPFWPNQFSRLMRIMIGACVFTIHTCQVIYGV